MHIPLEQSQVRFRLKYLYERSTYRYVRLNALNVLHIHGPCFNAPLWRASLILQDLVSLLVRPSLPESAGRTLLLSFLFWADQQEGSAVSPHKIGGLASRVCRSTLNSGGLTQNMLHICPLGDVILSFSLPLFFEHIITPAIVPFSLVSY